MQKDFGDAGKLSWLPFSRFCGGFGVVAFIRASPKPLIGGVSAWPIIYRPIERDRVGEEEGNEAYEWDKA